MLRTRTPLLVAAPRPETLRRFVDIGGNATQRGAFVLDAACGMDVDALITRRPYRDPWPHAQAIAYVDERAGLEFDPQIVQAFVRMMQEGDTQVRVLARES